MPIKSPLAGDTAAQLIRALLDYRTIWTTHDMVTVAQLPAVAIHPLVAHLESESLLTRTTSAAVEVPDWLSLLHAWVENYSFSADNTPSRWRAPRGVGDAVEVLAGTSIRHAVTGSRAAKAWAPDTPAGPVIIYTPDAQLAADVWGLESASEGDVLLAEPPSDVVFLRTRKLPFDVRLAAPTQVLADLLTGAMPSPDAASPLITWMESNERDWRY